MKVDGLRIGHHELDLAKRVAWARRLTPALDRAVWALDRNEAFLARGFLLDALGHLPPGIEDHANSGRVELRGRRRQLAGDRTLLPAVDPVLDQRRVEARHVYDDIFVAEVARQPAPAVEVEPDTLTLCRVGSGCFGERGLQRRILRVGRQQPVERLRNSVRRKRRAEQSILLGGIEVGVGYPPVDPGGLPDMAKRKIGRDAVKAIGRIRGDRSDIAALDRLLETGWIVV